MDPYDKGDDFDPAKIAWVMDDADLGNLLNVMIESDEVVIDLETTGLDEHSITNGPTNGGVAARVALAAITVVDKGWYDIPGYRPINYVLPLSHPDSPWLGKWREALRQVCQTVLHYEIPLNNQNVKFDCRYVKATTGVDLSGRIVWDPMMASHLLDENSSKKLKERAPAVFDIEPWDEHDLSYPGAAEKVDMIELGVYGAQDTYWTWRLSAYQRAEMFLLPGDEPFGAEEVEHARLGKISVRVDMPKTATLTAMEQRGIGLDTEYSVEKLREAEDIVVNSRRWLVDLYADEYGRLEIDPDDSNFSSNSLWFRAWASHAVDVGDLRVASLTPTGQSQWTSGVLTKQARNGSEVAETLLRFKDYEKRAQFMRSWLASAHGTGRIFSNYNAATVVTGRLCVSPDSLIEMPRDMTKYPDGVPLRDVKEGDWVYSFDHHMELTLRQVEWVGATKVGRTVIVTFENEEGERRTLQCTPDHLVRLYNGDWRHAEYLLRNVSEEDGIGPRVLSMVRRGWKEPNGNDRYLQFFPHSNSRHTPPSVARGSRYGSMSGGKCTEHRWVMEKVLGRPLSTKWDVNHIDGNKVNNHPSNLEYLPASDHRSNSHRDGTWGKDQPGTETYTGPNNFRVVSIEDGPTIEVWDMTIPEDHQFIANGIVVHNSSSGPNMQQVAKSLRPCFVPSPGYYLADIDYSQIELRVAAHMSQSIAMIESYQNGDDLHKVIARQIMQLGEDRRSREAEEEPRYIELDEVTPEERQKGKAGNFGLLYGMGAMGFQLYAESAYNVILTEDEAQEVYRAFFETWDGVGQWHARQITAAHRDGQVTSPIGRVRRLPDIFSANDRKVSGAERQAINAPVQGFASDLMQMASASIEGLLSGREPVTGARLVGTVHDSILVEVPIETWEETTRECIDRMVGVSEDLKRLDCHLTVPLVAEAQVSTRWGLSDVGELE